MGKIIGIDLGTTNSVLSYMDKEGAVNFVKIAGDILIPSYLFFKDKETIYFGNKAFQRIKTLFSQRPHIYPLNFWTT